MTFGIDKHLSTEFYLSNFKLIMTPIFAALICTAAFLFWAGARAFRAKREASTSTQNNVPDFITNSECFSDVVVKEEILFPDSDNDHTNKRITQNNDA